MLLRHVGEKSDGESLGKGRQREALPARRRPLPFPALPYRSYAKLPLPWASHC